MKGLKEQNLKIHNEMRTLQRQCIKNVANTKLRHTHSMAMHSRYDRAQIFEKQLDHKVDLHTSARHKRDKLGGRDL